MDYYIQTKDGQQAGPYSLDQLKTFWASRQITLATPYWTQGMTDWQPVRAIEKLLATQTPVPTTPVAAQAPEKPKRKGLGCGQGCLGVACLAFVAVVALGIVAAMSDGDPTTKVTVIGTTGKSYLEILSNYTPQLAGDRVAEEVYNVAATYPQLTEIDMELELSVPGGLVDSYGHTAPGPYIMGTLRVNDLNEVRKYANAGSYGIAVQDAYAIRIMGLNYANQLEKIQ